MVARIPFDQFALARALLALFGLALAASASAATWTVDSTSAAPGLSVCTIPSGASNRVTRSTLPDAPSIGTATAGDGSVTVSFSPPINTGGSPILYYNLLCSAVAAGNGSPITLQGLPNGVPQRCRVNAVNVFGPGPLSDFANIVTPQAVTSLTVSTSGSPSIAGTPVSFTAALSVSSATGTISFDTGAGSTGCAPASVNAGIAVCTTTFTTIGERQISANYSGDAAHRASSAQMPGSQSVIAPTITIAPALSGGVVATAYGPVQLLANGGLAPHQFSVLNGSLPNGLTLDGQGLLSGMPSAVGTFNFTINASDANNFSGTRAYSSSVRSVPDAPLIGTATPGDGSASLMFSPPANNGGDAVIDYTASCSPGSSTATGSSAPLTITGLSNGLTYQCAVRARNAIGSSGPSAMVSVTPAAPVQLADLAIGIGNGVGFVSGGAAISYVINVSNSGPSNVIGARVESALGAEFSAAGWTCVAQIGGQCAANGGGNVDQLINLPAGASARFVLTATLATLPETAVLVVASVTPPAAITDPAMDNNVASDGPDVRGVFRNGWE